MFLVLVLVLVFQTIESVLQLATPVCSSCCKSSDEEVKQKM
jgi:hypothetical protein